MGRPTDYNADYHNDKVFKLSLLGLTDREMADIFDISESTLNNWKELYPKFLESLKKGKDDADSDVAKSLYERAKGYSHEEDKIFCNNGEVIIQPTTKHYPPDTGAAIIWLKNRKAKLWRDKVDIESTGDVESLNDYESLRKEVDELKKDLSDTEAKDT